MTALTFAIPSKGRLQEQAIAFLADAGVRIKQSRGDRDYAATFDGMADVSVSLLSASEISGELHAGRLHMGISGQDLLHEHDAGGGERIVVIETLGFGRADVVVAVPRAWIDVSTMADLDDVASGFHLRHHRRLRIATKFVNLTRAFFASHGIADYRIVESLGATEGAPAAGTAEAIVDITTTGATLAANDLKILDDGLILESQAVLAASLRAQWSEPARHAARTLLDRLAARAQAKVAQILRVRMDPGIGAALPVLEKNLGARVISIRAGDGGSGDAAILIPDAQLSAAIALLRGTGTQALITTKKAEYVFAPESRLFRKLEERLG